MRLGDNPMEYATLASAVNIPTEPVFTEGEEFSLWDSDGFGFGDILDVINPLQHIPVVSNIYRELTGDDIGPLPRIAGGALFGGVVGAAISLVNVIIENGTGKDVGGLAIAMVLGDEDSPAAPIEPNIMLAKAQEDPAQPVEAPKKLTNLASGPPIPLSPAQPDATEKSETPAVTKPAAAEIPQTLPATPVGPPVVLIPLRQTATGPESTPNKAQDPEKEIGPPIALATPQRPETPGTSLEAPQKPSRPADTGGPAATTLPAGYRVIPVQRQARTDATVSIKAAQDAARISATAGAPNRRPGLAAQSTVVPGPWVADNMIGALEKYDRMSQMRAKPATVDVRG